MKPLLRSPFLHAASLAFVVLTGCSSGDDEQVFEAPDRAPADRTPLTAS